ncbi:MAG: GGDEF domain-containing protein [Stomatobaculum sp.]|nr:GGDEF domain-containing protein [Stomatobaculum sp.]
MNNQNENGRGIRLHLINLLMIAVASLLTFGLVYATWEISVSYEQMRVATDRYIACEQAADNLKSASDYLTEQVRLFVMTGDAEKVHNYFEEVNISHRRDRAVEEVHLNLADSVAEGHLHDALLLSDELKELEIQAMRLIVDGYGLNVNDFPREVRECVLPEDLAAQKPAQKIQTGRDMVFDRTYQTYKEKIDSKVALCMDELVSVTKVRQENSSNRLLNVLRNQHILIGLLLVTVLVIVFLTTFFVIVPLRKSIDRIQKHQYLPMAGSYEFQYLAQTYNSMFRSSQAQQKQLSYEATHDALTGLYNRSAFDTFREQDLGGDVTLLLIDADKFKDINDNYGHAVGDKILIKLASTLRDSFRAEDYVCRIGGDEFAVIMVHCTSAMEELIRGKVARANEKLQDTSDGLPPISISVGVAFSDRLAPSEDIFKDADKALYKVKESGRKGVAFF